MQNVTLTGHPHGYFLVPRRWRENFDGPKASFSKAEAWLDLLERAAYQDKTVTISGLTILVCRGQIVAAVRYLAEAWGWNKDKVALFLKELEAHKAISLSSISKNTDKTSVNRQTNNNRMPRLISINGYNDLQGFDSNSISGKSDSISTFPSSMRARQSDKLKRKETNKEKNNKEHTPPVSPRFLIEIFPSVSNSEEFIDVLPEDWRNFALEQTGIDVEMFPYVVRAFWERFGPDAIDGPEYRKNWLGTWMGFTRQAAGGRNN